MAQHVWVMALAMVLAVMVMMLFAKAVGDFVTRHPSMQILALSFLMLIGVLLVAEGFGQHVSKGYVYFAMAFALLIELVNMRQRNKVKASKGDGGAHGDGALAQRDDLEKGVEDSGAH
jgi:predicted tellurium resistance membrane protein TerC